MKAINYLRGDATAPIGAGNKIVAHVCNDVGAWGSGFVLAVSRRWSEPEAQYRRWPESRFRVLGQVQVVQVASDTWVANMIAQQGIGRPFSSGRPPIRYEALQSCLEKVATEASSMHASVHMPRIGCGLSGGSWGKVEPIVVETLCAHEIEVVVYDWP